MPRFIVKNGPKRQPQNRGCVSCIFGFFFLNFSVIFPLFLLISCISCCFIPSWNSQTAHQMRLQAYLCIGFVPGGMLSWFAIAPTCYRAPELRNRNSQESAKGAGGKGARVINCHNFFFTPDRETRRIDHTTTEGTAERKMRQFATPAPFTPAPFRPFWNFFFLSPRNAVLDPEEKWPQKSFQMSTKFGIPWTSYRSPFRAGGPKWGWKWPKNGFWPRLKNGGRMARKMGKMARNSIFEPFWAHFFPFSGPFFSFSGPFSPHFPGEAKIHFSAIFVPISGRRPEMDLYEVHGIPTTSSLKCPNTGRSLHFRLIWF